jgi:type VI secretion system protein ImpC
LRSLPESASVGLVAPRFLIRAPFGRETDPTEQFHFEEMTEPPAHEDYLWANGAFAVAYTLAAAFNRSGWSMRPGQVDAVPRLPMHIIDDDGERVAKPCAEARLTMRAAQALVNRGIMPLLSVQNQDIAQVGHFRSLSATEPRLRGRWG